MRENSRAKKEIPRTTRACSRKSIWYTLYSIRYTVYIIQYTLYSIHYTVYIIQYTLYSIRAYASNSVSVFEELPTNY
jgi:hypothetical protein